MSTMASSDGVDRGAPEADRAERTRSARSRSGIDAVAK